MTPDGREVNFRCHHNHRTQSAAVSCANTVHKQIEHGQSLNLVTRVRSTPASREATRQRALQKEADRQAKAAQHAQAAAQKAEQRAQTTARRAEQRAETTARRAKQRSQTAAHRAEQQEIHRQTRSTQRAEAGRRRQMAAHQRAQRREALAARRQQGTIDRRARHAQAEQERAERWEQAARQQAERWDEFGQRNEDRRDRVHQRREERTRQRPAYGCTIYGLVIGAVMFLTGIVLAASAGSNSHSALAAAGALLVVFGIVALVVSGVAALWRRLRRGRRGQANIPPAGSWNVATPACQPNPMSTMIYDPSAFPGQTTPESAVSSAPPVRRYDAGRPGEHERSRTRGGQPL